VEEDIPDITCFKFGDERFWGLASAEGQILPFPIDFDGRPYNTLTLPCERVIIIALLLIFIVIYLHRRDVCCIMFYVVFVTWP